MDTKLKAQLYDIILKASMEDINKLVEVGNVKIREEDVEKYKELSNQLEIIKEENQENPRVNIPGTDIPKPRFRKENETDNEYIEFLKSYYAIYFPEVKNTTKKKRENTSYRKSKKRPKSLADLVADEELIKNEQSLEDIEAEEIFKNEATLDNLEGEDLIKDNNHEEIVEENKNIDNEEKESDNVEAYESQLEQGSLLADNDSNEDNNEVEPEMETNDDSKFQEEIDDLDDGVEITGQKDMPKNIWERIKSLPFIGKAVAYLENIINKRKEEKEVSDTQENLLEESEELKDFNVGDGIEKIVIDGVEPLTTSSSSNEELFDKIENGTAYDYSDQEKERIKQVKSAVRPEMDNFVIDKILKIDDEGKIFEVNSASHDDLDNLIFEVSNTELPDYVFARYSGKAVKNSLKNEENIPQKKM